MKNNTTNPYRVQRQNSMTFYYQRRILETTIPDCKQPWLLQDSLQIINPKDNLEPKRIFDALEQHGIKCSLVLRSGVLNSGEDAMIESKKHKEWWLFFESPTDKTAAMMLI